MKTTLRLLLTLVVLLAGADLARAQQPVPIEYDGAAGLGLALRKLGVAKRVLMIAAHPDDESTQILAALALGQGADVAYLSLTRGEGGQNGIGPELQEALGLLRSEELLSARRLDGARQYFTRAYDFGFSKTAEETLRHWPREAVLADVVAVIRAFRPDMVVSVFTGTPLDGHGHHQVAGMMAREGFAAAADPARFAEQLARGLRPHRAQLLYAGAWRREGAVTHRIESGTVDPLLGRSHFQVAMASRSRHRSQDMGREETPGPQVSGLQRVHGPDAAGASLWAGLDTTLVQYAARGGSAPGAAARMLADYERRVVASRSGFNALEPDRAVDELAVAARLLEQAAAAGAAGHADLGFRVERERDAVREALARAAGVILDATAGTETLVAGQQATLTLRLWNGGARPIDVARLEPRLPAGWTAEPLDSLARAVAPGALATRRFRLQVAADAATSEPYYLRAPREGSLYRWAGAAVPDGAAFEAPAVTALAEVGVAGVSLTREREATFLGVDKMSGEFRRPLRVVPEATLALAPEVLLLPTGGAERRPLRVRVRVTGHHPEGVAGRLRLSVPSGWSAPAAVPLRLTADAAEQTVELEVRPAAGAAPGAYAVGAVFETDAGARHTRGFTLVDYPHVRPRPLYREARSAVVAADVRVAPGLRVGYVVGAGDDGPAALEQLGVRYDLLDAQALASADLAAYGAVVVGIRAYEVRPDLTAHNARLLEYARRGGTVIVQYNKYEFTEPGIAPFPLAMARPHGRVTDPAAAVRILDPAHRLMSWPNRIGAADFAGWEQERGLYFLSRWDERYTPLLEMADAGEAPQQGALVIAAVGEGHYVYTGLALFRQLPAAVPGAYRLFANLVSLGAPAP